MSSNHSFGVSYTPSIVQQKSASLSVEELKTHGIRFIRLTWVDFTNNVRYRVIPITYFLKMLATSKPSVCVAKVALGLVFVSVAAGFSATGEYLYVPDMSTIRIAPYAPGHASVMGWFQEQAPVKGPDGNLSVEVPLCPRSVLKRIVQDAKSAGIEFLVGFETEFILLRSTDPIRAVNDHGWSNSPALASGTDEAKVLEEIADALQESGIELQMYHSEAAPGQYEIVTGPLAPLEAADALVQTRETLFNIATKYGLRATLAPRVYMDTCGSGAHTHMSVHSTTPSTFSNEPNLNSNEAFFLAGLLEHLPAVTALTYPLPASYKRMADGVWSGGTYVCWGTGNREAPVRLCNATSPSSRNFELKTVDGTANPYLVLAGILGAGLSGIKEKRPLNMKDCCSDVSAANMSEQERNALGIKARLPLTWEKARENLDNSKLFRSILGDELVTKYLSVNKLMAEFLEADNEEASLKRLVESF